MTKEEASGCAGCLVVIGLSSVVAGCWLIFGGPIALLFFGICCLSIAAALL